MLNKIISKALSSLLFLLILQPTLFSQIITVKIEESFDYSQKSDSYTFYIVEELAYLEFKRMDEETRDSEFNKRIQELHDFLDENNLVYQPKPLSQIIKENHSKKKMVLKRHDLEISNDSSTRDLIKKFVGNQVGILFRYHPLEAPLDKAFIKSCVNALAVKAREEAEVYSQALNKTCGEIHEIRVLKQITNTKREKNPATKKEVPETATHIVFFTMEFSFETIENK